MILPREELENRFGVSTAHDNLRDLVVDFAENLVAMMGDLSTLPIMLNHLEHVAAYAAKGLVVEPEPAKEEAAADQDNSLLG